MAHVCLCWRICFCLMPLWILFAIIYHFASSSFAKNIPCDGSAEAIASIFSTTNVKRLYKSWWDSSCNLCEWNSKFIVCLKDSEGILYPISLQMESLKITGSLNMDNNTTWPSTIRLINLNNNLLSGSISWSNFHHPLSFYI